MIDVGRVGVTTDHPSNLCPPKLVVYTTLRGDMVRSHELPDSVVPHTSSFLNDLVLDYVDPEQTEGAKYVYISDTIGGSEVTTRSYLNKLHAQAYIWSKGTRSGKKIESYISTKHFTHK